MKRAWILIALAMLAVLVLAVLPFWGMEIVPFRALWAAADEEPQANVLWQMRIPRVAMAFLAGAALATSGLVFQAMFRNPLATPFTLGVSSGAALGAALAIRFAPQFSLLGISATSWCAFAGAIVVILLVYGLGRTRQGFSPTTLLLAGVAVSFFFSSLILLVQYLSDFTRSYRMLRWVMGGLESVADFADVANLLPFVVCGCLIVFVLTRELNLLATGEELAASRGVEVQRIQLLLFVATSLMVGAVVALCGPIGFVGLIVPHILRLVIGPDHRWLMPAVLLFGGTFLVVCDGVARTVIAPTELPVGIITALLGGPFFLWLLLRRGPSALSW